MRSLLIAILVSSAAAGCTDVERSHVWLDVRADPDPLYLTGARAWEELGFTVDLESSGLPPCATERDAGCELRITLVRPADLLEMQGVDALSVIGARQIAIDARVTEPVELRRRVSHEVGHVVLFTHEHATGLAVMAGNWTAVTEDDRAFACRVAELCD